jgi:hypothetical protein
MKTVEVTTSKLSETHLKLIAFITSKDESYTLKLIDFHIERNGAHNFFLEKIDENFPCVDKII